MLIGLMMATVPGITSAASYTTSASVAPATAPRGSKATITATVKSSGAMNLLIDLEVYSPSGQKVFQQAWDNQSFTAGQQRSFSVDWTVPANSTAGAYKLKIGLFSVGWGTMYNWNDNAGTLTVSTGTVSTAT